jgi:hypothetical protein
MLIIRLLLVFQLVLLDFECFNFDLKAPVYKRVTKRSVPNFEEDSSVLFGYSVAQHTLKSTRTP